MKTYEDYMFSGPMTDGEEIRSFFEEISSFDIESKSENREPGLRKKGEGNGKKKTH